MQKLMRTFLVVCMVMSLVSCKEGSKSTTTGNPYVNLVATGSSSVATVAKNLWQHILNQIVPSAFAFPAPATMSDSSGNVVSISSIWWTIGEVEFKFTETASGGEVDGDSIEFNGPYSIDILSSTPTIFASGPIASTQLRRLKTKLKKTVTLPSGAPAELMNKSIYIGGNINGHTFSYSSEDETTFEISGPNLVNVYDDSNLLLELQTANLIKRINLSAITSTTHIDQSNRVTAVNPCPNIDPSATDLYTCFRKGIETETNLGRDEDFDNSLDMSEEAVD